MALAPRTAAVGWRHPTRILIAFAGVACAAWLVLVVTEMLPAVWNDATDEASGPSAAVMAPDRPVDEFALAPDGQRLAFTANDASGRTRLWIRSLTPPDEQPLEAADGASSPFWSDDGRFVAYVRDGALHAMPFGVGDSRVITPVAAAATGAWSRDDVVVFARDETGGPLYRVSAAGGTPTPATELRDGEVAHLSPVFHPSGRLMYTVWPAEGGEPSIHIASLDAMDPQVVLSDASNLVLAHSFVMYLRRGSLTVQPFDVEMLIPRGDPIEVGGLVSDAGAVRAFSLSADGVLAYQMESSGAPPPAKPAGTGLALLNARRTGAVSAERITIVDWRTPSRP